MIIIYTTECAKIRLTHNNIQIPDLILHRYMNFSCKKIIFVWYDYNSG